MAKPDTFSITLTLGDETLRGSGATALEALQALPVPSKIVGKGFLTITNGLLKKEQMLMPVRLKRLFWPNAQAIQAKYLTLGLK